MTVLSNGCGFLGNGAFSSSGGASAPLFAGQAEVQQVQPLQVQPRPPARQDSREGRREGARRYLRGSQSGGRDPPGGPGYLGAAILGAFLGVTSVELNGITPDELWHGNDATSCLMTSFPLSWIFGT